MKKLSLILTILIFNSYAFALHIEAKYNITYGSFIQLGIANATLETKDDRYKIKIEAITKGMANILTNNRIETYESTGRIINNEYIPDKYLKIKKSNHKNRVKEYTFDYEISRIDLTKIETMKNYVYDGLERKEKETRKNSKETLAFFAKNDLLSLFFNLTSKIKDFEKSQNYSFKSVGSDKEDGTIELRVPSNKKLIEIEKLLKKENEKKIIAYVNQNIFDSEKGELFLSLNKEGFCTMAVLKDVLLFGDVVGKMTSFNILEE